MREQIIDHILSVVKAPLNNILFYPRIFSAVARHLRGENSQNSTLNLLITQDFDELTRLLDRSKIQESTSARTVLRSRQLAKFLFSEKGEILLDSTLKAIQILQANLYSIGPQRQYDAKRQEHLLNVLQTLYHHKEVQRLLKKISKPLSNKYAENLIRDTLQLAPNATITDAHTRQAVLAAWMCYLRQNVGSCFATAPAEIIQYEQPEVFLQDMADLLSTGRLKRTFGGIEYAVPISASWGSGDLKKPLFVQRTAKGFEPELWLSPGLMAAFTEVGLIQKSETIKQKADQIENWLTGLFQRLDTQAPFFIVTAEDIIRLVLMQSLGLTEQNLKDFENRPRNMLQSQLMLQAPRSAKNSGGVGERCAYFLYQFEMAKNAFKSITDNALLKAWEFTVASFSETKLEFTSWNLYASLGMGTNEPSGIGECIYQVVQQKLDTVNRQLQDMQAQYESAYTQVKTLESRMRHASTEQELQWLKIEYQGRSSEYYALDEQREILQAKSQNLVHLYESLYNIYLELFKEYFQEVYDADMQEVSTGPFDDSPAGYRLLYKHGRSNTSQWTRVTNPAEYVDALGSFFSTTESQITATLEKNGLEKDLGDVITAIITHIKTKEFLESAFHRMAIAHQTRPIKDPLEHLDLIEKKPWAYTSGGTMNTLASCYFRLGEKPSEVEKWVESEFELLVFLADALKHIPPKMMEPFIEGKRSSLLMQSPTHAFLLKPMLTPFKESWTNEEFTYTFLRDKFFKPAEHFVERLILDENMMSELIDVMAQKVLNNFQPRFKAVFSHIAGPLNPIFFRDYVVDILEHDRGLNFRGQTVLSTEEIDSILYSHLPFCPVYDLRDRIKQILSLLPTMDSTKVEDILKLYDQVPVAKGYSLVSAHQLQDIVKALICLFELKISFPYDIHLAVSLAAQRLGFAMPTPLIFADSNWVKDFFGFVVNPGNGKLELWRLDYTGSVGHPMNAWKEWVDGSRPDKKWGLYVKPFEYGQV